MSPFFDLQLDQGEEGPSGDVQSQEEMGVCEAIAIHSKLSTAIRCEHFWGGQEVVGLGSLLTGQHNDTTSWDSAGFPLSTHSSASMPRMAASASMWGTAPSHTALRRGTCGPS